VAPEVTHSKTKEKADLDIINKRTKAEIEPVTNKNRGFAKTSLSKIKY
jgi:hypothetical protein